MKSTTLAFFGSIALAGTALGQTPPAPPPAPKPPSATPAPIQPAQPQPSPQPAPAPGTSAQGAQNGAPAMPTPSGPPEGMIVETPDGFYLVRPGGAAPQRLDIAPHGPQMGQNAQPGDDAMGDRDDEAMQPPPPPHPRRPPPPHPMEGGKGAHVRIHTPNMNVDVKCPEDEPMKGCVDAVGQLVDKLNAPPH